MIDRPSTIHPHSMVRSPILAISTASLVDDALGRVEDISTVPYSATKPIAPSAISQPLNGIFLPQKEHECRKDDRNNNDEPRPLDKRSAPVMPGTIASCPFLMRVRPPRQRRGRSEKRMSVAGTSSALHQIELVDVSRLTVAEDHQDDRDADTNLGGSKGDDEEREDLACVKRSGGTCRT